RHGPNPPERPINLSPHSYDTVLHLHVCAFVIINFSIQMTCYSCCQYASGHAAASGQCGAVHVNELVNRVKLPDHGDWQIHGRQDDEGCECCAATDTCDPK